MEKISDSMKRKSLEILKQNKIRKEFETDKRKHFLVQGESSEHIVIFDKEKNKWTCDCSYFALKQKACSHVIAAEMKEREK